MDRAVPVLPIEDMHEARAFYVDGLGFQVVGEGHYPNEPVPGTILFIERGTIRLSLDSPMPGHGRNIAVNLEVDDADALYADWDGRVEIPHPPQDQPWGGRTFGVTDPSGNLLYVVAPRSVE